MMVTSVTVVHPKPLQIILKETDGKSFEYEYIRPWLGKANIGTLIITASLHFSAS